MKKSILSFAIVITTTAAGTGLYLSTLPNPTDIQKQLSNTVNVITIAGTTAIFGLLDDEGRDNSEDK
jgi:hypothetical protein